MALLSIVLILAALGLLMVYSAGSYYAQDAGDSAFDPLKSQLLPLAMGLGAMLFLANVDYRFYKSKIIIYGLLAVSIMLLAVVWIPGIGILRNGSRRWLPAPGGITVQPGEIAKFTLVIFSAYMLDKKKDLSQILTKKNWYKQPAWPILIVCGIMFGLVMLQPNLSTAGCFLITVMAMLFIGGFDMRALFALMALGLAAVAMFVLSADYRSDRLNFLHPWDMVGNETYQLVQSLYAIASGGLFGVGIGQSRQKLLFLPYCESDFIYSIICEELGFFGALLIVALFCAFIFLGFKVALRCKDRFGSLLAAGITAVFAVQVILHIAVVSGCFPTTGLPLPFFSAGGTNLLIFMGASGILLNISRYTQLPVNNLRVVGSGGARRASSA